MWIVVGLGNPGPAYEQTRHNIGFMTIEVLAQRWSASLEAQGNMRRGLAHVAAQAALLVQPQTFMNRSGEALALVPHQSDDSLVAVYDDLDLPTGMIRVRPNGGSGGHRGVASLIQHRGPDFIRVRVGIGRPPTAADVVNYVLAQPTAEEHKALMLAAETASDAVECVLTHGTVAAMNKFNSRAVDAR